MIQEQEVTLIKKYQWKKGERIGEVVEVLTIDSEFVHFKDGTKIYNLVLPEFLEEIIGDELPFPIVEQMEQTSSNQGAQWLSSSPPIKKPQPHIVNKDIKSMDSPIELLVAKLSKKNVEQLEAKINLNIPGKDVFNMLIESADEDREELIKTIAKVAVSQIEINKLQEYLTEEVLTFINNYYND